jgi:hypothetical protein
LKDAFQRVIIKWTLKFHRHKIEATSCSGSKDICQPI